MTQKANARDAMEFDRAVQLSKSYSVKMLSLLYDHAIKYLREAISFAERGECKKKNVYANKTIDMIAALYNFFDADDTSHADHQYLTGYYAFIVRCLMRAKFNNDTHGLNNVLQMLQTGRESWGFGDHRLGSPRNRALRLFLNHIQ
jgi:flagellar biosynthetic protein FliS